MDIMAESALQKLLADYGKLHNNTFWLHFLEQVDANRLDYLGQLGRATNEKEADLRVRQGYIRAFDAVLTLPETLVQMAQNKLEGQSETTPGDEYE